MQDLLANLPLTGAITLRATSGLILVRNLTVFHPSLKYSLTDFHPKYKICNKLNIQRGSKHAYIRVRL